MAKLTELKREIYKGGFAGLYWCKDSKEFALYCGDLKATAKEDVFTEDTKSKEVFDYLFQRLKPRG